MHNHASTDSLGKRPDLPHSARSSRRILTVDPLPGGDRQVFATGSACGQGRDDWQNG